MGDDVVAKHVHVFLNHRAQVLTELLHVVHEVRINVVLQSTYSVIVLNKASTGGLLHHVEHMLTVTHAIKEGSERTQVLSTA